jgi:NAD(P)-dependent dehydrogenase (short-subunit alcohol dehydrogenase family)
MNDAVLVTGGATGIGLAISLRFASEGKPVYVLAVNGEDDAAELDRQVGERGLPRPHVLKADVRDRARLAEIASDFDRAGMRLHTVVACAGINVRNTFLELDDATIRSILDTDLYGVITTFQVFGPLALRRPGSRFIAISSLNSIRGMRLRAPYSAAKAGVNGLVQALAVEWGPLGATVNAIAPGIIVTPLTKGYIEAHPECGAAGIANTPAGRLGLPEDIAYAAAFLASEGASFVTGQVMVVDGGQSVGNSWW